MDSEQCVELLGLAVLHKSLDTKYYDEIRYECRSDTSGCRKRCLSRNEHIEGFRDGGGSIITEEICEHGGPDGDEEREEDSCNSSESIHITSF